MSNHKRVWFQGLLLTGILTIGALVRFWRLEAKPLWLDEAITALIGLGRGYEAVPVEVLVPLARLTEVFTLQPETTCRQIAQTLATQSTHPPLFFCWLHRWLVWWGHDGPFSVWQVRALPVLFGVGAIAVLYAINRLAFSRTAGLSAAALMAVSPFAVYLSQEARHYTLPMLLIALGLLCLVQIQCDLFQQQRLRTWVWVSWMGINAVGLYVHYFCLLAFAAQVTTLACLMVHQRQHIRRQVWVVLSLATIGVLLLYLPWWPTFVSHFTRPETGWVPPPYNVSPFYQLLAGWLLMAIALPVEQQPAAIAVPCAALMLAFGFWLVKILHRPLRQLWQDPTTHLATLTILGFTTSVILEFLAIAYLLGKDLSSVPRYNFVYYPGMCALLGAGLGQMILNHPENSDKKHKKDRESGIRSQESATVNDQSKRLRKQVSKLKIKNISFGDASRFWNAEGYTKLKTQNFLRFSIVILVGLISSSVVISGLAFRKPYAPQQVARHLSQNTLPLEVIVSYRDFQDIALGLSFALAVRQHELASNPNRPISWAFLSRIEGGYDQVWQTLAQLPQTSPPPINLWVVAPKLKRKHYPLQLTIASPEPENPTPTTCKLDPAQHYRIGIPYQLYRCDR